MNRTALFVLVLAALMAVVMTASADLPINFTVLDQRDSVLAAPVAVKLYERPISGNFIVTDSTLIETKVFRSGSGQTNGRISQDFTGDGEVGFDDFFLLASAFGSKRGDTGPLGFVERIDLDRNDKIDFDDFFKFVEGWEQTYATTRFTLVVSSADTLFVPLDTTFVGPPAKPLTLKVQVKNLRQELTAFVLGDTSRIFVGDTLAVRAVRKTFYGARQVSADTLSDFEPGSRLVTTASGILKINVQSGQLATLLTVRVQSLRRVLVVSFPLGKNTIAFGDSTVLVGLIKSFRGTVLVLETSVPIDSLKISIGLKTSGRFIVGDKVGTFQGTAEYQGLTASFELKVNPPPDKTPPTIRLAVDPRNSRLTLAVSDSSGQVTVKAAQDGTSLLSGTFAKLDTSFAVSLRDFSQPVFRVTATDKFGNSSSRDTTVSIPDRTPPYIFMRRSDLSLDYNGTLHLGKLLVWDGGSGVDNRFNPQPLKLTVKLADGKTKSWGAPLWDSASDTLFVSGDVQGFFGNAGTSSRKVTVIAEVADRAGNVGRDVVEITQPGQPPPPPPPQETPPPPPPPPPANVAPSFTAATASRGGQSFPSGSTFSATIGQPITFTVTASGTPTPSVALTYSDNNGVTWNAASNPFSPNKAVVYRFKATASNGVTPDAVATWTANVQLPPE